MPVTARRNEMLIDVIDRLVEKRIHRLWIVDEHSRPIGVVSMTDICKLICVYVDATSDRQAVRTTRDAFRSTFLTHEGKSISVNNEEVMKILLFVIISSLLLEFLLIVLFCL